MARRGIEWSESAQQDLLEIKEFIGFQESLAARKFIKKLAASPKNLLRFPNLGSRVPELDEQEDHRQLVVGGYRLSYRATPDKIEVLRILHHAREFSNLKP